MLGSLRLRESFVSVRFLDKAFENKQEFLIIGFDPLFSLNGIVNSRTQTSPLIAFAHHAASAGRAGGS
ncbi:unnamed protein product [Leptosia nina]|uniref:Uncharacterized protein n=1 Tax=Leptosia nina TaxID=320188 RepID=A0AAV1JQE4_9NEOP